MSIVLPTENELSDRQKEILSLPVTDSYLVKGGPGTGKTVLAIYRAKRAVEQSSYKPVIMLVYNNPLKGYISAALRQSKIYNVDVSTYHQWIYNMYWEYQLGAVPKFEESFKWDKVVKAISGIGKKYAHIVVDEAQDFPVPLIKLLKMISENYTFFIDPDQAIEEGKTDVPEFIRNLLLSDKVETLSRNFRNTYEVRKVASLFCLNDEPPFPSRSGKKPIAIRCNKNDFDDLNSRMAEIILKNAYKNIGIITASKMKNNVYKYLKTHLPEEIPVQIHIPRADQKINFSLPGVKIVTFGTMKGLEFDIVIIPLFDCIKSTEDKVIDYNRIYVAITRTLSDLYLLYWKDKSYPDKIDTMSKLFENQELFEWWG